MRPRTIVLAAASLVISFFASLWIMDWVSPRGGAPGGGAKPALAQLPPLPPASRVSTVFAPVTITLASIRDAADRAAPRNFNGKVNNPAPQLIQNSDINWTAARGTISATGTNNALALSTVVTGTVNAKGSISQEAGGAISGSGRTDVRRQDRRTGRPHRHPRTECQRRHPRQRRGAVAAAARPPTGVSIRTSQRR